MSTVEVAVPSSAPSDLLGHPRGLAYLCFAEAWERFSYYGMLSLLSLYMTKYLLRPGHVEHVAFFPQLREVLEAGGALTPIALASMIAGLYAGIVYLTPLFGGLLADLFLGRTLAVTLGAISMVIGHFLMAFEVSFLAALVFLLVGVGLFKGNIASQVGELYAPGDLRRASAFQIYLLFINLAVIVAPIACGGLGEKVAWHWGFGAAGVGMLLGLIVYRSGRKWLPPDVPVARGAKGHGPRLNSSDWTTILVLSALIPVLALCSLGNQQIFGAYLIWGDAHYDLKFGGQTLPTSWLVSLDAIISSATIVGVLAFWRLWSKVRRQPDEIVKITIGAFISATAPLLLALGSLHEARTGEKVSLAYGLGFHLINDIGFAMVFPVGLALYSRAAPRAVAGLMISVYYLNLFLCNSFAGYLGRYLEKIGGTQFWLMNAGLVALGGLLLAVCARSFRRILAPTGGPAMVPSRAAVPTG